MHCAGLHVVYVYDCSPLSSPYRDEPSSSDATDALAVYKLSKNEHRVRGGIWAIKKLNDVVNFFFSPLLPTDAFNRRN
jgi:hypothetical protein